MKVLNKIKGWFYREKHYPGGVVYKRLLCFSRIRVTISQNILPPSDKVGKLQSSPFFSVYGATKAAMRFFIESVNEELEKSGSFNKILNLSPGSIKGTGFNQGETDLNMTKELALAIIENMLHHRDLFIPQYDEIFHHVLDRYHEDFREEGRRSYDYKLNSGRI